MSHRIIFPTAGNGKYLGEYFPTATDLKLETHDYSKWQTWNCPSNSNSRLWHGISYNRILENLLMMPCQVDYK